MAEEITTIEELRRKIGTLEAEVNASNNTIEEQRRRIDDLERQARADKAKQQETWRCIASRAKEKGTVVYHPNNLSGGGYGQTPSIGAYCPDPVLGAALFGAQVGDRVATNTMNAAWTNRKVPDTFVPEQTGVIISTEEDRGTEIAVKWHDGTIQHHIWCAKKGHFALVYW